MIIRSLATAAIAITLGYGTASAQNQLPEGCVPVTVTVPNVPANKPDVPLTLRGENSGVEAIKACNPNGRTNVVGVNPSPTAGSRIILRTSNMSGIVGLPKLYAAGDIHNVACAVEDGKLVVRLVERDWKDGLPERGITLEDRTVKLGDLTPHVDGCRKVATPDILAQLKPN